MPVIVPLFTNRPPFNSMVVPAAVANVPDELIVVRLPPPSTRFDPLLLRAPPPLIVMTPLLDQSLTFVEPLTVNIARTGVDATVPRKGLPGRVRQRAAIGEIGERGWPGLIHGGAVVRGGAINDCVAHQSEDARRQEAAVKRCPAEHQRGTAGGFDRTAIQIKRPRCRGAGGVPQRRRR